MLVFFDVLLLLSKTFGVLTLQVHQSGNLLPAMTDNGAHITKQFLIAVMHSVAVVLVNLKPLIVAAGTDPQQGGSLSNTDELFAPDEFTVQTGLKKSLLHLGSLAKYAAAFLGSRFRPVACEPAGSIV